MQHIAQPYDLQHTITVTVVSKPIFPIPVVPEPTDSSAPMVDVQDNQILVIFNVDGSAVDFHCKYFGQVKDFIFLAEDVK